MAYSRHMALQRQQRINGNDNRMIIPSTKSYQYKKYDNNMDDHNDNLNLSCNDNGTRPVIINNTLFVAQ